MHIKHASKFCDASSNCGVTHLALQRYQLLHFKNLNMPAEAGALRRKIGINVEHAAVVVTQNSQPVVFHDGSDSSSLDPLVDLPPDFCVALEHPTQLKEGNAAALKHIRDFGSWASRAVSQPLPRHFRAITETVHRCVIDGFSRTQVQQNQGDFGPSDNRQDGRGKSVGRHVQEDQIHVAAPEIVPSRHRFFRRIHHPQIDDLYSGAFDPLGDEFDVPKQPLLQPLKLRPVGFQSDAKEANPERGVGGMSHGQRWGAYPTPSDGSRTNSRSGGILHCENHLNEFPEHRCPIVSHLQWFPRLRRCQARPAAGQAFLIAKSIFCGLCKLTSPREGCTMLGLLRICPGGFA